MILDSLLEKLVCCLLGHRQNDTIEQMAGNGNILTSYKYSFDPNKTCTSPIKGPSS